MTCIRRRTHATLSAAQLAARTQVDCTAYRCDLCGKFHVKRGTKPPPAIDKPDTRDVLIGMLSESLSAGLVIVEGSLCPVEPPARAPFASKVRLDLFLAWAKRFSIHVSISTRYLGSAIGWACTLSVEHCVTTMAISPTRMGSELIAAHAAISWLHKSIRE